MIGLNDTPTLRFCNDRHRSPRSTHHLKWLQTLSFTAGLGFWTRGCGWGWVAGKRNVADDYGCPWFYHSSVLLNSESPTVFRMSESASICSKVFNLTFHKVVKKCWGITSLGVLKQWLIGIGIWVPSFLPSEWETLHYLPGSPLN